MILYINNRNLYISIEITWSIDASRTRSAFLNLSTVGTADTASSSVVKSAYSLENMPAKPISSICPGVICDESTYASYNCSNLQWQNQQHDPRFITSHGCSSQQVCSEFKAVYTYQMHKTSRRIKSNQIKSNTILLCAQKLTRELAIFVCRT